MKWENLKLNKCPSCGKDLAKGFFDAARDLIICKCGFRITQVKMATIVSNKITTELSTCDCGEPLTGADEERTGICRSCRNLL